MNLQIYNSLAKSKVTYLESSVSDLVFDDGYLSVKGDAEFKDIELTETVKESICRMVGISPSLSKSLYSIDKDLWDTVLCRLYSYHEKESIVLILNEMEDGKYSTKCLCNVPKETVSNERFISKVINYMKDYQDLSVSDITYSNESTLASVVILNNKEYEDYLGNKYQLGFVVYNDELTNGYCRGVMYKDGVYYYLTSKMYNLTTSRYDKSTNDSYESLDIMLLRITDDYNSGILDTFVDTINKNIEVLRSKNYSYQEYSELFNVVTNLCTKSYTAELDNVVEMLNSLNDLEEKYGDIKSDYLWKCTAFSSNVFDSLIGVLKYVECNCGILPEDLVPLREYAGMLLSSKKMVEVIAHDRSVSENS